MTEKEIEVLNTYLGDESRKISTGNVFEGVKPSITYKDEWGSYGTSQTVKTVLDEISDEYKNLYEVGKRLQEAIKPYRYMLEEGNIVEYLQTVGTILFRESNIDVPRSEAK